MRRSTILAPVLLLLAIPATGGAQTATTPMIVTATVADTCSVRSSALSFGAVNQGASTNDASPGSITLFCSANKTGVTVTVSGGDNENAGQRRMSNGSGGFIPYDIHNDPGRSSGTAVGGTIFTGNVSAATESEITVYGSVPAGNYPAGSYSDSLTVVFNY